VLHERSYAGAAPALAALGVPPASAEAFWLAVRGNLGVMADAAIWRDIVFGPDPGVRTEPEFLAEARRLLPQDPFDPETWGRWTEALKTATGRKGRALFMPLRLALTGREHGPELKGLLPLWDRATVLARLS
jgi:glutamyl-tRNA synthetase